MGFIFEPTPASQGWTIEVRKESFYLHDPHGYPTTNPDIRTDPPNLVFASENRKAWCFHVEHLSAVLACFDMLNGYLGRQGMTNREWADGLRREATVVRLDGETVSVEGDYPEIHFPDNYRNGEPDMGGVELTYAEAPRLEREFRRVEARHAQP